MLTILEGGNVIEFFFFEFFTERYKHISRESFGNIIFLLYYNVKQNDLYNLIFLVESLI